MKNALTTFAAILLFSTLTLFQAKANACVGSMVEVNDASWIGSDGLYGRKGREFTIAQLQKMVIEKGRAAFTLNDKNDQPTHGIEFIGSISDAGGVIQSSYVLVDLNTREEKTLIIKSTYAGNGVTAKSVDRPSSKLKPYAGFKSVLQSEMCK